MLGLGTLCAIAGWVKGSIIYAMRKIILIDDDTLIHQLWRFAAFDAKIELDCFETINEFLKKSKRIPKDSVVYIDSELRGGIRGEEEAWRVKEAGFENIYIATGYDEDDVDAPDFVLGVVGKRPEF